MKSKRTFYTVYILLLIAIYSLSSCSGAWHLRRAIKKDPDLFKVESKTKLVPIKLPPVRMNFDCSQLFKPATIELYSPILIKNPVTGTTTVDSVKVILHTSDSTGAVTATVDCPDIIGSSTTIQPTIFVPPSKWLLAGLLLLGAIIGFFIAIFLVFKVKK